MKIQPAVKKETGHIACWSGAGTILMIVAFAVCHKLFPDAVPFDYKVVLGGVIGAAVSVGNLWDLRCRRSHPGNRVMNRPTKV